MESILNFFSSKTFQVILVFLCLIALYRTSIIITDYIKKRYIEIDPYVEDAIGYVVKKKCRRVLTSDEYSISNMIQNYINWLDNEKKEDAIECRYVIRCRTKRKPTVHRIITDFMNTKEKEYDMYSEIELKSNYFKNADMTIKENEKSKFVVVFTIVFFVILFIFIMFSNTTGINDIVEE
jgi:uncharacterized integral membrane protein